ncbi:hypothetical protein N752_05260 [Desulforamulus aquiferis]|nr:hypothetical protein [Desulforamulus aquiferis]RYD06302.1 hypothetical protein N752_05260 [Desulforamulus aquiferis]
MKLQDVIEQYCSNDENIIPVYKLVESYNTTSAEVENGYVNYIKLIDKEISKFKKLIKTAKKAQIMAKKATKNFNKDVYTEEQLDKLYDSIEFVENMVKDITRDYVFMHAYQYTLRIVAIKVSLLGKGIEELSIDVLLNNIKLQQELIKEIINIGEQFIDTFNEARKIVEKSLDDHRKVYTPY